MAAHTKHSAEQVALVDAVVTGNMDERRRAAEELRRLLDARTDLTAAAARVAQVFDGLTRHELPALLPLLNLHPPVDWPARLDRLFVRLEKGKTVREKQAAEDLLMAVGGADRWSAPLQNLHVPDLWPRLWRFADSPHSTIADAVRSGISWGLRACPDRRQAEQFIIDKGLAHAAVDWACMGDDTRGLMDRLTKANLVPLRERPAFKIVYELQHGRADAALEQFHAMGTDEQGLLAQNLALLGKRIRPVTAVIEWIGGILDGENAVARYKAAWAACERAQMGQDIGPILANLGRVLDTTIRTAYGGQALWWSAAALAVAATRMSTRKKVALSALESRLSGKAVAREGAGYGLAMAAVLSCDWDLAGQLLSHSDAKVCAGAVLGCHNARNHMPESLSEANQILQPVFERIRLLANDPRKDVSKAAAVAVKQW